MYQRHHETAVDPTAQVRTDRNVGHQRGLDRTAQGVIDPIDRLRIWPRERLWIARNLPIATELDAPIGTAAEPVAGRQLAHAAEQAVGGRNRSIGEVLADARLVDIGA